MANIGYARGSIVGQSLALQLDKLAKYGCDEVYKEVKSGVTTYRPILKAVLGNLQDGDTLIVTKLDRFAKSTYNLTQIAKGLKDKGAELVVIDQDIDTSTPTGKLWFDMLASIEAFETGIRKERHMEGMAKGKAKGAQYGAKPKLNDEQVKEMQEKRQSGISADALALEYNVNRATVYRLLKAKKKRR